MDSSLHQCEHRPRHASIGNLTPLEIPLPRESQTGSYPKPPASGRAEAFELPNMRRTLAGSIGIAEGSWRFGGKNTRCAKKGAEGLGKEVCRWVIRLNDSVRE